MHISIVESKVSEASAGVTASIRAEVNGREVSVLIRYSTIAAQSLGYEAINKLLRQQFMAAIEHELFGDFNRRPQ